MHSLTNTVKLQTAVGKKVEPETKVMCQVSGQLLGWQLCVGPRKRDLSATGPG